MAMSQACRTAQLHGVIAVDHRTNTAQLIENRAVRYIAAVFPHKMDERAPAT